MSGIQYSWRDSDGVTSSTKTLDQFGQQARVLSCCHSRDVFHNEDSWLEFLDYAQEMEDQTVPRIVKNPMANKRESLARRPANDRIYRGISDSRALPNFGSAQFAYVGADNFTIREIQFVDTGVNRIVFHGRDDVEAGLLESQR